MLFYEEGDDGEDQVKKKREIVTKKEVCRMQMKEMQDAMGEGGI